MHPVLTRAIRVALFATAAPLTGAACQTASPRMAAVNTVLDWRLNWLADETPFNACSVYQAAGSPADFPSGILPGVLRGLDRASGPWCEGQSPGRPGAWTPEARIDSVSVHGEAATVFVTVRRGEISFRETYSLVNPSPRRWGLSEVRTWGALREYPVPPASAPRP